MSSTQQSQIRPGHGMMTIGVLAAIAIDYWHMHPADIVWTRGFMFLIKVVFLAAWYEQKRDTLVEWFVNSHSVHTASYHARVAVIDGLWYSLFSSVFYGIFVLIQHVIRPEKDPLASIAFIALNMVGCFFAGGILGIILDIFKRLWEWAEQKSWIEILTQGPRDLWNLFRF